MLMSIYLLNPPQRERTFRSRAKDGLRQLRRKMYRVHPMTQLRISAATMQYSLVVKIQTGRAGGVNLYVVIPIPIAPITKNTTNALQNHRRLTSFFAKERNIIHAKNARSAKTRTKPAEVPPLVVVTAMNVFISDNQGRISSIR